MDRRKFIGSVMALAAPVVFLHQGETIAGPCDSLELDAEIALVSGSDKIWCPMAVVERTIDRGDKWIVHIRKFNGELLIIEAPPDTFSELT